MVKKILPLSLLFLSLLGFLFWHRGRTPRKAALSIKLKEGKEIVYVSGSPVGSTPLYLEDLPPGEKKIKVGDWVANLNLQAGTLTSVLLSPAPWDILEGEEILWLEEGEGLPFEALAKEGLAVASVPEGAKVEVDGKAVGYAPLESSLSPGEHHIKISKEGYESWETRAKRPQGYRLYISFKLPLRVLPQGEKKVKPSQGLEILDLSLEEPLLWGNFSLWAKATYWKLKEKGREAPLYFLSFEGDFFNGKGEKILPQEIKGRRITLGYLGRKGEGLTSEARDTLEEMGSD